MVLVSILLLSASAFAGTSILSVNEIQDYFRERNGEAERESMILSTAKRMKADLLAKSKLNILVISAPIDAQIQNKIVINLLIQGADGTLCKGNITVEQANPSIPSIKRSAILNCISSELVKSSYTLE